LLFLFSFPLPMAATKKGERSVAMRPYLIEEEDDGVD
jgi:hypothetical protein